MYTGMATIWGWHLFKEMCSVCVGRERVMLFQIISFTACWRLELLAHHECLMVYIPSFWNTENSKLHHDIFQPFPHYCQDFRSTSDLHHYSLFLNEESEWIAQCIFDEEVSIAVLCARYQEIWQYFLSMCCTNIRKSIMFCNSPVCLVGKGKYIFKVLFSFPSQCLRYLLIYFIHAT